MPDGKPFSPDRSCETRSASLCECNRRAVLRKICKRGFVIRGVVKIEGSETGPRTIENESENMKPTKNLITLAAGLALIVGTVSAQPGNNIAASPKLREMMNSQADVASQAASAAQHSCAMCRDEYVTRVDQTAKGAIKPTVTVMNHLCPGCETSSAAVGQGKAARNVVSHKCIMDSTGSAGCCATGKT